MKFLLSSFLIFSSLLTISQSSNVIVEENRIWSTLEVHCMPNGNNYSTFFIKFEEDTLIDGLQYKRMWHCDEPGQTEWTLYGFMREDENNRVFVRPPDYIEGMVYDFGCSVGDTLITWNVYLNNDSLHFVVTQIDSVLLFDGYKKRITLFEYNNELEEVWVEGLGSYSGILYSGNYAYGAVCGGYEALCFEDNGELIYQHSGYNTCYYDVSVNQAELMAMQANIYPNPASEYVTIDFKENEMKEIQVLDLNSKIILKKLANENKVLLNLQELDKGYYIIKIISKSFYYPPCKLIVD
jgi:hypothetical protein